LISLRLDHRDLRLQLLDLSLQILHSGAELFEIVAQGVLTIHAPQNRMHGVAGKIRHAARTGQRAQMSERRVLLFGEADTDHAGTWLQDCHAGFIFGTVRGDTSQPFMAT